MYTLICIFSSKTLVDMFSNNELQYTKTITDEIYIKTLTGN